jgi:hypothetical protein
MRTLLLATCLLVFTQLQAQTDSARIAKFYQESLSNGQTYENLRYLCKEIGHRLSGSEGASKAVSYTKKLMEDIGADSVWLQEVMVPHWVRGEKEYARIDLPNGEKIDNIPTLALGGSVGTPKKGISAQVVELTDFDQLHDHDVKGKIVFFNRPMEPSHYSTFEAYSGAVNQRSAGASHAAEHGAIGVIIRSMSLRQDDFPHTGAMRYKEGVKKIPAAAISTNAAANLSQLLKQQPELWFHLRMSCETLPDVLSYNVVGEIKGSDHPEEIIVVSGHLDSWDVGDGAHDDGGGCLQSIEVLRLFRELGIQPKRTIRAVMYMNEENGLRGARKYAELAKANEENHIAAFESDAGVHSPRGFSIKATEDQISAITKWTPLFVPYGVHSIGHGHGGADINQLAPLGTACLGLLPDIQRYFDYHHAPSDVFEAVNKRELELGSATMASMVYLIATYGL